MENQAEKIRGNFCNLRSIRFPQVIQLLALGWSSKGHFDLVLFMKLDFPLPQALLMLMMLEALVIF